jgi:group I intron endonuclease
MKFIVYLTINLINNKKYVGSHCTDNLNDNYLGSGKILHIAIRKYGKKNFKKQILKECESAEESRNLEEFYINQYNTLTPNGYNISITGGSGISGKSWGNHTEKTKKHLSESLSGEKNGFYGKKHTEETKKKIGDKNRNKKHSPETIEKMKLAHRGQKLTEEHKRKISESRKGEKNPMYGKPSPMRGKKHTKETKKKISNTLKGRKLPKEIIEKISKSMKIVRQNKNWSSKKRPDSHNEATNRVS